MSEDYFDKLVADLQKKVIDSARRIYSDKVLACWENPKNFGKLPVYNAHACVKGKCGDTVEIFLQIENKRIKDISFLTDGCIGSIVCNATLTDMAKGKSLEEVLNLSPEDIINILGGLPEAERHCAELAVKTLNEAIRNF